jgi:uncharacterized protein (TIGR00730 family)
MRQQPSVSWKVLENAIRLLPLYEQPAMLRLLYENVVGRRHLAGLPPVVALFGSARTGQHDPLYRAAHETAQLLAEAGLGIITGGGPGIMEAGNLGAREGGARSIGCPIRLAREERPNACLDIAIPFTSFAPRKATLFGAARAFVVFPGGFGTLDELFEVALAMQTQKLPRVPLILYGSAFWRRLLDWLQDTLVAAGTIDPGDLDLFQLVDSPQQAVKCVLGTDSSQHEVTVREECMVESMP